MGETEINSMHHLLSSFSKESNLADYNESTRFTIVDLNQYAKNDRGRGETRDDALPTLTTNSGKLYSKAVSNSSFRFH